MASFSDTLLYSLIVTLFGMGIVFIVLIVLQYILKAMKVVFYKEKKEEEKAAPAVQEAKAAEPVTAQAGDSETVEDEELVAVITAAIMSSLGNRSNIVVRNIRRAEDSAPVWSRVGRMEQTASRL